jgi:hypothetical protein
MLKNLYEHPLTTVAGIVIGGLTLFVANCPNSKYAAGATVVLGILAKDPF